MQSIRPKAAVLDLIKVMCGREKCALQIPQRLAPIVVDGLAERRLRRACTDLAQRRVIIFLKLAASLEVLLWRAPTPPEVPQPIAEERLTKRE